MNFSLHKCQFPWNDLIQLIWFQNQSDANILWRESRALFKLAGTNKAKKEESIREGFELIQKALELDENNYACHKWMAVLLDAKSELDGIKVWLWSQICWWQLQWSTSEIKFFCIWVGIASATPVFLYQSTRKIPRNHLKWNIALAIAIQMQKNTHPFREDFLT